MSHTPAPWEIAGDDGSFVYALNIDGVNSFWLRVQTGFIGGLERTSIEEIHANARLIAAAPDLLDALRELLAFAAIEARDVKPADFTSHPVINKVCDALRKVSAP